MKEGQGLVADGIEFGYRDHPVLRGAWLRVEKGKMCGLIGRNGCGKSTLMKVIAGELRQRSGIVMIDGRRFARPERRERYRRIARLPQEFMTPGRMRLERFVRLLPESVHSVPDDPLLCPLRDNRIDSLSTGERRYLEGMIVLSLKRDYVLLDEPFTGLSPIMIERLSGHIREAASDGKGILLSDHYSHYVLPLIDQGFVMTDGRCRELSTDSSFAEQLGEAGYIRHGESR